MARSKKIPTLPADIAIYQEPTTGTETEAQDSVSNFLGIQCDETNTKSIDIDSLYVYQPVRINSTNMTKIGNKRAKWVPGWQCAVVDGKHIIPSANIVSMTIAK